MDVLREKVIQATCVGTAASGLHLFLLSEHMEGPSSNSCPSFLCVWCWLLADTGGKKEQGLSAASIWPGKPLARPFQRDQDLAPQVSHVFPTFAISNLRNPAFWFSSGAKQQATQLSQKEDTYAFILVHNP